MIIRYNKTTKIAKLLRRVLSPRREWFLFTIRGSLRARVSAYKSPIKPPLRRCLFPKFCGVFRGIFKIYRTSPGDPYCFVDCSKPSPPKCVPRLLSVSLSLFFRSSQPSTMRTNGTSISFFRQTTKKSDYFVEKLRGWHPQHSNGVFQLV